MQAILKVEKSHQFWIFDGLSDYGNVCSRPVKHEYFSEFCGLYPLGGHRGPYLLSSIHSFFHFNCDMLSVLSLVLKWGSLSIDPTQIVLKNMSLFRQPFHSIVFSMHPMHPFVLMRNIFCFVENIWQFHNLLKNAVKRIYKFSLTLYAP